MISNAKIGPSDRLFGAAEARWLTCKALTSESTKEQKVKIESKPFDMPREASDLGALLALAQAMYFSEMPDRDRIAARTALAGCIHFVVAVVPEGIDLVLPLRDLLYALHDLDDGKTAEILKRAKKSGGRRVPISVEIFRAMAAVLMELYQQDGLNRDQAAEQAAKQLSELGFRDGHKTPITAQRVEDWRDKVNEGGTSLGAKRFKTGLELLTKMCPGNPKKAIRLVIASLPAIARQEILDRSPFPKNSD